MSHSPSASQQLSPEEKRALVAKLLQQKAQTEDCTYRLSYGQRALWFLYQSNRDSHAYNLSIPARIKSPVDIAALKQAFQGLVDRHPTLRTTFTTQADGDPVQVVHGTLPVYFELIDATKWSQDQLNQCVLDTHRRPFDLENGPVFKVVLFTLNPQEHILLLSLHHITYDAWSHGPFLQDAQALYVAAKAGTVASLPPLQKQYSDYVQWQIETLMGPEGERLWSYWQTQLGGDLSTLNLPTDRPRPLHPSYKGDTYLFKLTPAQTQAIKQLAQAEGTTLYIVLMAVFQILLYRYTGQSDILVGSPIGDRPQAEFEPVLGYFVNPVAIRGRLADTLSCQDFLGQIRTTVLDAIDHQNYPFPLLVERLQPDRDPSRSPIFQVLFNFLKLQPTEVAATLLMPGDAPSRVQWADLELESFQLEQQEGQFDVTLEMIETPDDLIGVFKYSTDLFNVDTIERMAGHFQTLLTGIAANPQQSIDTLPLLSAVERHQLLSEWNNTQTNFSQNHHHPCIHQLFEAQIDRTPHDIAVVFESEQITYQDLNTRANQLAHYLRSLGVGPEVRVGICIERSIDMVVGVLGILKAGGAYVPLDPAYPQERLAFMAEDAQMAVLLTQTHLRASLPNLQSVCLDRDWQTISAVNEGLYPPDSQVTSDHLAYIIYTSGSTGQPKGVQIPHRNAVNLLASVQTQPGLTASDTLLAVATLSFDISVAEVFLPLMVGAKLVIASREVAADGFQLLQAMETHQPTFMQPTPATWRMLLAAGWTGSPYLKMISTAEPLPRDLVTQLLPLGKELWNLYGPTETTIWSAGYQVMTDDQPITIGYPIANTQLYILDSHMQPLPIGIPGELYIGGAGLALGYLNRPELTADKFIANPLSADPNVYASDRLYRTGDLARWLPNGQVECLGRLDYQVKIRGFRIELGAVETALGRHPQIKEAIVVAREDEPGHKRLVAYLVTTTSLSPSELRRHLKVELPDYMVPSAFVFLAALPLTPNGKVDRRALPAPEGARADLDVDYVAPHTAIEKTLADIWADILRVDQVGIHDNFFELGGESILSIQIIARANQAGLKLTTQQIFQHQTIAGLATVAGTVTSIQSEQGPIIGAVPLTPIQSWFLEQQLAEPHYFNQAFLLEVTPDVKPDLLKQSVQQWLSQHDALRLRFVQNESTWQQVNAGIGETFPFTVVDLSGVDLSEQQATIEATAVEKQASLDLAQGPLLQAVLFKLGINQPGRLLLVIHHLAVDGVSWRILLEDLVTAYQQLDQGNPIQLPAKTTSFKAWANQLVGYAHSDTLAAEWDAWLAAAAPGCPSLPVDYPSGREGNTVGSVQTVSVALSEAQTHTLLKEVPQVYNTQINDVLLTALVQSFAEWTREQSLHVNLEGHGREELFDGVDLSRTVGWFTSLFPVALRLDHANQLGDALKAVKEQLRRVPNRGIGYGILRYLSQDPTLRSRLQTLSPPEVSFNYLGQFDQMLSAPPILGWAKELIGSARSPLGRRCHLLEVDGFVAGGRLCLEWRYSEKVHRQETVVRLAESFLVALQALITHCQSPESGGYTPSDFSAASIDQQQLDKLLAKIQKTD